MAIDVLDGWAQAAAIWVGASITAGVLGNAAYDALKAALGRLRRREAPTAPRPAEPDLVLIAQTAVNLRCQQLGLDKVVDGDVEAISREVPHGWEIHFRHIQPIAKVLLVVDVQRQDVRAEVRLHEEWIAPSDPLDLQPYAGTTLRINFDDLLPE